MASITHEFRTPLNASIPLLDIIKDLLFEKGEIELCESYIIPALNNNITLLY